MLEPKKQVDTTANKFMNKVEKSLGQEVEIRASSQEVFLVCRDTDEVRTEKGAREPLET